jgi:methylenetetrahydrofolate reductase (NADPH)
MRIADLYSRGQPVYSFEFFPPKTEAGVRSLFRALDELRRLEPDFVSVTYPLERSRRSLTIQIVSRIKAEVGLEAMAHLTCVDASREELTEVLKRLEVEDIENILALRGDPPSEEETTTPRSEWFPHASDLVSYTREHFSFSIGGAAHPEKHPEAPSFERDLANLKLKVASGCEFLITQFFFENTAYFELVQKARNAGIQVPIVPGIMPVTGVSGIKRMAQLNGATIPAVFLAQLESVQDDPQRVEDLGVAYAQAQCQELINKGAPGIHFFTLNRSPATRKVLSHLRARESQEARPKFRSSSP